MDTEKPRFSTTARMPRSSKIATCVILAVVLALLNVLFLTGENAIELRSALLIDGFYVVICAAFLFGVAFRSNNWQLDFEGDVLTLTNLGSHKQFQNWDSPLSDRQMKLTSPAKDEGRLIIRNTVFRIEGVQNFAAMQAYIEQNYKHN